MRVLTRWLGWRLNAAVTVRSDAGFFSYDMIDKLEAHDARWSITVPQNAKVKAALDGIDEGPGHLAPTPQAAKPR